MRISAQEYHHPTQASRVRLEVFEMPDTAPVSGMPAGGFLVTEVRTGTHRVVSTLGAFGDRPAAEACARARGEELVRQQWRTVSDPA